jgi:hypothetical protein
MQGAAMSSRRVLALASLILLLLLARLSLLAEEKAPADKKKPAPRSVIVWVDSMVELQTSDKKPISKVEDAKGKLVLAISDIEEKSPEGKEAKISVGEEEKTPLGKRYPSEPDKVLQVHASHADPAAVLLGGVAPGTVRITLVDRDGRKEVCDIFVRPQIFVPIGSEETVQLSGKKPIKSVKNEREKIIRIERVADDPRTVKVRGLAKGDARLSLTGEDGKVETYEVTVRSDRVADKNTLLLPLGKEVSIQASTKKFLQRVVNDRDKIIRVGFSREGPSSIVVTGLREGFCHLSLTDRDKVTEIYEVIVRKGAPVEPAPKPKEPAPKKDVIPEPAPPPKEAAPKKPAGKPQEKN